MPTLTEKLQAAIDTQRGDVERLVNVAKVDLPAAQARLATLDGMLKRITPELEESYVAVKKLGIKFDD